VRNPWRFLVLLAAGLLAQAGVAAGEASHRLQGQVAPDFALKATSGTNYRLSEYRGDVVLLAFWGSRCGQCGAQLDALNRLVETYRSAGLMALAVNVDDNQAAAVEYARARPVSFPVLLDPDKGVARAYRVDNLPMLLLIDRSGQVRHVHRDYRSGDERKFVERIRPLLDE
jgi:peroxiredoxin